MRPRRFSNTLDASFCTETLDDALAFRGPPEIMNTDQGRRFTSLELTDTLKHESI